MRRFKQVFLFLVTGFLLTAGTVAESKDQPAPSAAVAKKIDLAISSSDTKVLSDLLSKDFSQAGQTSEIFSRPIDKQAYLSALGNLRTVFDQLNRTSEVLISSPQNLALAVTWQGIHSAPYMGVDATGRPVMWKSIEVWQLNDLGQLSHLSEQSDVIAQLQAMTDPRPGKAPYTPAPARTIGEYPAGVFLESVIADDKGTLYVTRLFSGEIFRVTADGTSETAVNIDLGSEKNPMSGLLCITWADNKSFYATVHSPDPTIHGIWVIGLDGSARQLTSLPPQSQPNGIAVDSKGMIYSPDSGMGLIWKIDPQTGQADIWYDGPEVNARPYIGRFPASNGLQIQNDTVYVAASDKALFSKIAIEPDGKPGPVTIIASGVPGDDFALDSDGTAYVTTHPFNTVMKVAPNGDLSVIATPAQDVVGPAASVLVAKPDGKKYLYVVTDGGLYAPLPNRPVTPAIVELDITP